MPADFSDSTNPIGTRHAMSPVLTLTATSSPNGGAEHGTFVSGFQKRPTAPPHGDCRTHVVPPLVIGDEDLREGLEILDEALTVADRAM